MRVSAAASIAVALLLALASPAAAEENAPTGQRINLFGGFQVFPAGQPFYIAHGWSRNQTDPDNPTPVPRANGRYDFSLAVDGREQSEDYVDRFHGGAFDFNRLWVHNFPGGMTGTHTFTGHWSGPCTSLVERGLASGPCENPVEPTTSVGLLTITVVFVS